MTKIRDMRSSDKKASNSSDVLFRIPLNISLKKVDLPPMDIWSRLESTADNLQARLPLQVLTKGWLFDTVTDTIWRKCVLSPKGYLIVYVKEEKLRGYALDITLAKKIRIEGPTPKYAAKKGFTGTEKDCATATIKWSAGSVCLFLSPERFNDWTTMLLAFQGSRRCLPTTTINNKPVPEPEEQKPMEETQISQPTSDEPMIHKEQDIHSVHSCSTIAYKPSEDDGLISFPSVDHSSVPPTIYETPSDNNWDGKTMYPAMSDDTMNERELPSTPKQEDDDEYRHNEPLLDLPFNMPSAERSVSARPLSYFVLPSVTILGLSPDQIEKLRGLLVSDVHIFHHTSGANNNNSDIDASTVKSD